MIREASFMIAVLFKNSSHGPIWIPTRVADTEVRQPCAGDFVTVHAINGNIEYCIRLKAPTGPQYWRGVIFAIARGGEPVLVAQGLELDDVVELSQSAMVSIIRCLRIG